MSNISTLPIIDAWAQPVFKEGALPEVVRLFQQSGSAHMLGMDLPADELVRLMDEAGVRHVMLSAWHRPGKSLISNDAVVAIVRQYPDRFSASRPSTSNGPSKPYVSWSAPSPSLGSRPCG